MTTSPRLYCLSRVSPEAQLLVVGPVDDRFTALAGVLGQLTEHAVWAGNIESASLVANSADDLRALVVAVRPAARPGSLVTAMPDDAADFFGGLCLRGFAGTVVVVEEPGLAEGFWPRITESFSGPVEYLRADDPPSRLDELLPASIFSPRATQAA